MYLVSTKQGYNCGELILSDFDAKHFVSKKERGGGGVGGVGVGGDGGVGGV